MILMCGALAALALYIFIAHSATAERPFLNPKLLADRNYALGLAIVFVFGMLNFTPTTLLPPLMQGVRGYPDSVIGIVLGARGVGTLIGFFLMFWANKFDPRFLLVMGFACQAYSGWVLAHFSVDLTTWGVLWTSALQGFGVGVIWVPLTLVTFATLDKRSTAEATAIFHLVRNIGSSIFISLSITVALRTARITYSELAPNASPMNRALSMQEGMFGSWSLDDAASLAALSQEISRQSMMIGYLNAFHLFEWTALAVIPLVLLVKVPRR